MIQALGTVIEIQDPKIVTVALEGINFILKAGASLGTTTAENPFTFVVEECGLMDKLEGLQYHENQKVYEKAISILEEYFAIEEDNDIVGMLQNTASGTNSATSASEQFKQAFDF